MATYNPTVHPIERDRLRRGLRAAVRAETRNPQLEARDVVPEETSEFQRGLRAGFKTLEATSEGVQGIANAIAGDNEAVAQNRAEANRALQEAAVVGPTVRKIEDIDTAGQFADWVAGTFGQTLPVMAPMLAAGSAGLGLAGRAGGIAGAIGGSAGTEAGLIFDELGNTNTKLTPRQQAGLALGAGTAAGSLDALPVFQVFNKFGVSNAAKNSIRREMLKGGLQSGALEAGTEGLQTIIERGALKFADRNKDIFGQEGISEILNAMAAGGVVGAPLGAAGSGLAAIQPPQSAQFLKELGFDDEFSAPGAPEWMRNFGQKIRDFEANDEVFGAGIRRDVGRIADLLRRRGRPDLAEKYETIDLGNLDSQSQDDIKFSRTVKNDFVVLDHLVRAGVDLAQLPDETMQSIASYVNDRQVTFKSIADQVKPVLGSQAKRILDAMRRDYNRAVADLETTQSQFSDEEIEELTIDDTQTQFSDEEVEQLDRGFDEEEESKQLRVDLEKAPTYIHARRGAVNFSRPEFAFTDYNTAQAKAKELESKDTAIYTVVPAREAALAEKFFDPELLAEDTYVIKRQRTIDDPTLYNEPQFTLSDMRVGTPKDVGAGVKEALDAPLRIYNKQSDITNPEAHITFPTPEQAKILREDPKRKIPLRYINLPGLTLTMLRKTGNKGVSQRELAEAFDQAIRSLVLDLNIPVEVIDRELDKNSIIFYRGKDQIPVRWGDVSHYANIFTPDNEVPIRSMEYKYKGNQRPEFEQFNTTLEAAQAGARTATTRNKPLGKKGDIITFKGDPNTLYRVTGSRLVEIENMSPKELEQWSQLEGWSPEWALYQSEPGRMLSGLKYQTRFEKMDVPASYKQKLIQAKQRVSRYTEPLEESFDDTAEASKDSFVKIGKDEDLDASIGYELLPELTAEQMDAIARKPKELGRARSGEKRTTAQLQAGKGTETNARKREGEIDEDQYVPGYQRPFKKKVKAPTVRSSTTLLKDRMSKAIRKVDNTFQDPNVFVKASDARSWAYKNATQFVKGSPKYKKWMRLYDAIKNDPTMEGFYYKGNIYVNPKLSEKEQQRVLAHEMGHAIYAHFFNQLKKPQRDAIIAEFRAWKKTQGQAPVANDNTIQFSNDADPMVLDSQIEMLQFEEWFADQLAEYMADIRIPITKNDKLIANFANSMKRILKQIVDQLFTKKPVETHKFFKGLILSRHEIEYRAMIEDAVDDIKFSKGFGETLSYKKFLKAFNFSDLKLSKTLANDPNILRFVSLAVKAFANEKIRGRENFTTAQLEILQPEKFSELTGYTKEEIQQYKKYLQAQEELINKYGEDTVHDIIFAIQNATGQAGLNTLIFTPSGNLKTGADVLDIKAGERVAANEKDPVLRAYMQALVKGLKEQKVLFMENEPETTEIKKTGRRVLDVHESDVDADGSMIMGAAHRIYKATGAYNVRQQFIDNGIGTERHVVKYSKTLGGTRGKRKAKNVLLTNAMRKDPYSHESLFHVADFFKTQLTEQERGVLNRAFARKETRDKIESIIDSIGLPMNLYHAVAFQLWVDNQLFIGPQTETVFTKLLDVIRKTLGIPGDDQLARDILNAVATRGISATKRSFNISDQYRNRVSEVLHNTMTDVTKLVKVFGYTADSRMREGNPVFRRIADAFHARVGVEGTPMTYFEERTQMRGRFDDILQHILRPLNDKDVEAVFTAAQNNYNNTGLTKTQKKALNQLIGLFREANLYMKEAGVMEKYLVNRTYFPRVYDFDALRENKDAFTHMLETYYRRDLDEYAHAIHKAEAKAYGSQFATPVADLKLIMADLVHGWIMAHEGNVEGPQEQISGIDVRAGFLREQKFDWIDDKHLVPFVSKEFNFIMSSYIDRMVKTTAFQRRFADNRIGKMLDEAYDLGASAKEIDQVVDYVHAMIGRAGLRTNRKIHSIFGSTPPPGQVINPALQKAFSAAIVARNLMVLGLATMSSLVDPLGILVRSGDFSIAWNAYKAGANEIRQAIKNIGNEEKQRTEATLLAQTLGTIDIYNTQQALEWQYGGTYLSGTMKKINEGFFKLTGLTQWTQLTRTMATVAGMDFIKKHMDGKHNKDSMRYLRQLNLVPQDIVLDKDGNIKLLTHSEILATDKIERARDLRVKTAINRFVDESILRPNAAQRPIWASDPHYMLIFHLQSFTYSFHDRILRRVYTEFVDHKNITPALLLLSFPVVMAAVEELRDDIKYLGRDNPYKANWDFMDHSLHLLDRSGLSGVAGNMILSAKTDLDYNGFGFESRLGAVGKPLSNALQGRPLVPDVERLMPLNSVWRHWYE